jgi:hypothetical protein
MKNDWHIEISIASSTLGFSDSLATIFSAILLGNSVMFISLALTLHALRHGVFFAMNLLFWF